MASGSHRIKPALDGVPETLLIPLWARAVEQSRPMPLIRDQSAIRILKALNYDFEDFRLRRVEAENFCIRAHIMDHLITKALNAHPGRPVVEFGPGLDTRAHRLNSRGSQWLEIDLPEVISLREQLLPADDNRAMRAGSMLDDDWMDSLCRNRGLPPLFIAEGVFYFFSKQQIREFLSRLSSRFPGSSLVFDAVSSWYLKFANWRHPLKTSRLQFSLNAHARELLHWDQRYRVEDYIGFGDSPEYDSIMSRFPMWKRILRQVIPASRHAFMVVHLKFPDREIHL